MRCNLRRSGRSEKAGLTVLFLIFVDHFASGRNQNSEARKQKNLTSDYVLGRRTTNLDWKRLFKLNRSDVLGLDVGSSAVKIVQLRKDDAGYIATAAGIVDIATGQDSNSPSHASRVEAIRECLRVAGTRTRLAVCSVSGSEVAVRDFQFPLLPPEEVEGAVRLEAAQVCPFSTDDSSIDYQLGSPDAIKGVWGSTLAYDGHDNISGFLVAATNKLIKTKAQLAQNASLSCVLMDVDGLALLNCLSECERADTGQDPTSQKAAKWEPGQTVAVLNVGSSYTNLAIMSDPGEAVSGPHFTKSHEMETLRSMALPFTRDTPYAGDGIIEQIASENGISTKAVKDMLFDYENTTESGLDLSHSLARACQKLIGDVTETLRYYTALKKPAVVEKIFVCGGFALARGFIELLDSQLPAKAVLWNPFDKIRLGSPCNVGLACEHILQKTGPAMAVAAGLAMRAI